MKKLLIVVTAFIAGLNSYSQNVGIGTTNPQGRLDITSSSTSHTNSTLILKNGAGDTTMRISDYGRVSIGYNTLTAYQLAIGGNLAFFKADNGLLTGAIDFTDTSMLITSATQAGRHLILQPGITNVGIGTYGPQYKLDVNGRMRLRHYGAAAGLWLDGPTMPIRSFIGSIDNDHAGIYGNGGIGWAFSMNVNNGYVGIGVAAPTAALDVNGNLRIRSSSPKKGSTLTSTDVNGNAQWMEAIAFKATGGYNGAVNTFDNSTWAKVLFNQTVSYNIGVGFQPVNSQFIVAEKGIYHFDTQLHWEDLFSESSVRIRLNRAGAISSVAESYINEGRDTENDVLRYRMPARLSTDVSLEAGDIIWVEGFYHSLTLVENTISASNVYTWFSGHLVTRL